MELKNTKGYLAKLEDIFAETEYHLRYEKGNFQSGWCVLNDKKLVLVNKYYTTEGKINALQEILKHLQIQIDQLSDKNKRLFQSLRESNQASLDL
jgi:hypothetical protein